MHVASICSVRPTDSCPEVRFENPKTPFRGILRTICQRPLGAAIRRCWFPGLSVSFVDFRPCLIHSPTAFLMQPPVSAGTIKGQGALYGKFQRRQEVGTRDIAAVTVAYLLDGGYKGQTYPITGGQAVSYARIAEKFSASVRRESAVRRPSL
jgi:hypothetical protein